jgi:outer membrane protein assembly factor BamB
MTANLWLTLGVRMLNCLVLSPESNYAATRQEHRMNTLPATTSIAIALAVCALDCAAQEWARFRGPNGTGISHAKTVPTKMTEADINWKVELPGTGHSSPVLWGERIFLTSTGDKSGGISVLCLSARDGRLLWRRDFSLNPFPRHKFNSYAASTPCVDERRVYVLWNEPEHYLLSALDHEGKEVWQRDFGPFVSQHGCGISPIVYQDKVILGNEQDDAAFVKENPRSGTSFVVAVDAKTGRTLWQTPRRSAVVAYSTPCVYEPKRGKPALVLNSQGHGIYALDPDGGKVLWEYDQAFDKRSVSSPIIAGDIIFGSCGAGGGGNFVTAIKVGAASTGPKAELAYQMKKSAPYVPTGVAVGELVWLWSDSGIVTCLEAASGAIRYQERVGGNYFGSPVWVDGRLFCVSTAGELVVLEACDKFNVLHRYPLGEQCHSTPAVALGRMFIRTETHLVSLGGAKEAASQ